MGPLLNSRFHAITRVMGNSRGRIDFSRTSFIRRQLMESHWRRLQSMARRFLRRRTIIIGTVIVALSVGIVFASVPYLPHPPPRTLQTPLTHSVRGGTQNNPGIFSLTLAGVSSNDNFAIGVNVTNGMATFCVMPESSFIIWTSRNSTYGGIPFSFDSCILNEQTFQTTLRFTATSQGNWDVVAVNTNPQAITVDYTPAT